LSKKLLRHPGIDIVNIGAFSTSGIFSQVDGSSHRRLGSGCFKTRHHNKGGNTNPGFPGSRFWVKAAGCAVSGFRHRSVSPNGWVSIQIDYSMPLKISSRDLVMVLWLFQENVRQLLQATFRHY